MKNSSYTLEFYPIMRIVFSVVRISRNVSRSRENFASKFRIDVANCRTSHRCRVCCEITVNGDRRKSRWRLGEDERSGRSQLSRPSLGMRLHVSPLFGRSLKSRTQLPPGDGTPRIRNRRVLARHEIRPPRRSSFPLGTGR